MKLSVSLPEEDVEFLDEYAKSHGFTSRSAVVQKAVRLLGRAQLEDAYVAAWSEWDGSEDAELWNQTVADGLPE